ncbi:BadF/BadG/BcrA/BcrD ATPase family protein [Microlunatus antarcticus]|uniref:N-acetylglucosamine kinase-like BadF-type ATPase n=1 Tax=Microlunatus antarcticus TaxID=53388 RepID=A0A7W5JTF1_9ACTN|nr:N-acetylglucosamine kinase-like BadF-type ATPase [Microlunatus antarcticus]
MSSYYLGLDAGNSKTVALVADETGVVLGRGRGASGDIYSAPDAEGEVERAVRTALADAGLEPGEVHHAAFRLAGVDWPEDEEHWSTVLAHRLPELGSVSIKNDGFSLLRCGSPDGVGVAINAGTGPAVAARGTDGSEFCLCWWISHPLGGRSLGESAFRAVVDAELGSGRPTLLTDELLTLYGYDDVASMLHNFTRRHPVRPVPDERVAARSVLRAAGAGDAVAWGIVAGQAAAFAQLAAVAARRTGLGGGAPVPCVLGGSILTSEHPAYREALVEAFAAELGPVDVVASAATPVAGALLDALAEGGAALDQQIHDEVLRADHPAEFLLT